MYWSIGILQGSDVRCLNAPADVRNPVLSARHVTDIAARFVADPFMIRVEGLWHMFFEVMPVASPTGVIAHAESDDGLRWTYRGVVLHEPVHLSYPCVFAWKDDIYMVPESRRAREVRLYRADPFPTRWQCVGVLARGDFADPTPFRHQGLWWMYVASGPASKSRLELLFAESLDGPWLTHPSSPVVADDNIAARPAGRVVQTAEGLMRLGQNCSRIYGENVHAFKVEISRTQYRERALNPNPILSPSGFGWNARCMHHADAHLVEAGRWLACVDGAGDDPYP